MKKSLSRIPYNYVTIKTTRSRIDKGLLAIPVSLIDIFPKNTTKITLVSEKGKESFKSFTPYKSTSRECRIGGLKEFYRRFKVKDGDELVIQKIDDGKFKIVPELKFERDVLAYEKKFEVTKSEKESDKLVRQLSNYTNQTESEVLASEFFRLSSLKTKKRKSKTRAKAKYKEAVPPFIRKVLLGIYKGKCQLTDFTFVMKNGTPYFEVHHIKPNFGNHLKNLLVVSANIHAQFTFAVVEEEFDDQEWLRNVSFNSNWYQVNQAIDRINLSFTKETHSQIDY